MKRIGVLTSGGDAAGMNAAVRAVVRAGVTRGFDVVGIDGGFDGLIRGTGRSMTASDVGGILHRGGTILRTFRSREFEQKAVRDQARQRVQQHELDGLVVIGGDGSFQAAHCIDTEWDLPCVGVPATIDNDVAGTDYSIGYDTALNIAMDAIDKVRDTATSHGRIFVIEVMGRNSGRLALATALCVGAEEVLIPEREFDLDEICKRIESGYDRGKGHAIILVAEGASRASQVGYEVRKRMAREVREVVLGHIQRGGSPTAFDRILASRLGSAAVGALAVGKRDVIAGLVGHSLALTPLEGAPSSAYPLEEFLALQEALI